jgi:hypothetical protein
VATTQNWASSAVDGLLTKGHGNRAPVRCRLLVQVRAAVVMVAAALLLCGCAGLGQRQVEQVASAFAAADPSVRCQMLAPATVAAVEAQWGQPCPQATARLTLSQGAVQSSTVWGDQAQVHLVGDTVFLTKTGNGWRVTAAGCRARGDAPYACRMEGP